MAVSFSQDAKAKGPEFFRFENLKEESSSSQGKNRGGRQSDRANEELKTAA